MNNEEECTKLQEIRRTKRERLHHLEEQAAVKGIDVEPHIAIEIKKLTTELAELHVQQQEACATVVGLMTYDTLPALPAKGVLVDWVAYYQPAPSPAQWQSDLFHALDILRRQCNLHYPLLVVPCARLSAGIAFGYAFHTRKQVDIWVQQSTNNDATHLWKSTDRWDGPNLLTVTRDEIIGDTADPTLIELNIGGTTSSTVDYWLETSACTTFHRHITLTPITQPGPASVQNGAQAVQMAYEIRNYIAKAYSERPYASTAIMGSIPMGLAIFLGMHLNACGRITCYDYDSANTHYYPACWLP